VQSTASPVDSGLARATGFPEELLATIGAAGSNMRQLEGIDAGGQPFMAAGVTIDVPQSEAPQRVRDLQASMPGGYLAFLSEMNFGIEGMPDQVSVLRASAPYDALEVMGTNGWNYGISPQDVIARLEKWDAEYGLTLRGVGFDWVEAEFRRQPRDMDAFAREVYRFCPDVVEQGTETVEALAAEMERSNTVYLWWD
jgi:hypothetical protein